MVDGATLCNDVDLHDVFPFILFFFFCSTRDSGIHSRFSRQEGSLSAIALPANTAQFIDPDCMNLHGKYLLIIIAKNLGQIELCVHREAIGYSSEYRLMGNLQ